MGEKRTTNEYINKGDYTLLIIDGGKYGRVECKISNEDVEKCKLKHWNAMEFGRKTSRSMRVSTERNSIFIYRYIFDNIEKDMVVDHINRDTLDNRRENLRIVSKTLNCLNRNKEPQTVARGVIWYTFCPTPKWKAYISINNKHLHLGYFDVLDDAIKARRDAELKYYGENAVEMEVKV